MGKSWEKVAIETNSVADALLLRMHMMIRARSRSAHRFTVSGAPAAQASPFVPHPVPGPTDHSQDASP